MDISTEQIEAHAAILYIAFVVNISQDTIYRLKILPNELLCLDFFHRAHSYVEFARCLCLS